MYANYFRTAEALREEIFGPVRPVFKHRDISEVISFIPQGEKPLALCIFSESRVRIDSVTSAERQHECMYVCDYLCISELYTKLEVRICSNLEDDMMYVLLYVSTFEVNRVG